MLLLLRKLRRATMYSEKLRSAMRIANLILTWKNNLVLVDYMPASHLALVSVAELMGKFRIDNLASQP